VPREVAMKLALRSAASCESQEMRAQFLEAVLIERALGIGEHDPFEARFKARWPIVECDPLGFAVTIPIEPGLDLQLASVVDDHVGIDLRRRSDDPVPDVGAEIPLQLLDALGAPPIRRDDDVDRLELSQEFLQKRQMAEELAAERVIC
jgi:hypothetical protein